MVTVSHSRVEQTEFKAVLSTPIAFTGVERDTEIGEGQMHKDAGTGIRKEV